MPLFSASAVEKDIEKATSEGNLSENWGAIMYVCDKIRQTDTSQASKDCLKALFKRAENKNQHISLQCVVLLDALIKNAGRTFLLEFCSREYLQKLQQLISHKNTGATVSEKAKKCLKEWAKSIGADPQFNMLHSVNVDINGPLEEPKEARPATTAPVSSTTSRQKKEEEDLARAIAASLAETEKKNAKNDADEYKRTNGSYPVSDIQQSQPQSLYGGLIQNGTAAPSFSQKQPFKTKALYDFEAAEDNELTFKAGDIITILDDSDTNWWKGAGSNGEGLLPSNFVSTDMTAPIEEVYAAPVKKVQFGPEVEVRTFEKVAPHKVCIDEEKMKTCLNGLQDADIQDIDAEDDPEQLRLEDECKSMGSLIDDKLEKIDKTHEELTGLNKELLQTLDLYHQLMASSGRPFFNQPFPQGQPPVQQMYYPPQQPFYQYQPQADQRFQQGTSAAQTQAQQVQPQVQPPTSMPQWQPMYPPGPGSQPQWRGEAPQYQYQTETPQFPGQQAPPSQNSQPMMN